MFSVLFTPTLAKPEEIPPIAQVLGIRVGHDGMDRLERVFGTGKYSVGGHPDGVETWLLPMPYSEVSVEGFTHTRRDGELIENLDWYLPSIERLHPSRYTNTPPGWLGSIVLGMPKVEVLKVAEKILGKPAMKKGRYYWNQRGRTVPIFLNEKRPYTTWEAAIKFNRGKLSEIQVHCGPDS